MAVSQERISVHSLADLKNTSDDALPPYLNSLSFTQSHTLTDTRLALGYSAFAICCATFYWDYTYGFESTKTYTLFAVILYTILNSILTFWIWGVEKGTVYVGTNKNGETVKIRSKNEKHVPKYVLTVETTSKEGRRKRKVVKREFREWFDSQGHFHSKPFQQMLAQSVEVIGKADPKNAVKEGEKPKPVVEDNRTMDEKWASLLAESEGADATNGSSTATPAKGGKKRGKKA
ncbi:putative signal peptidase complex subunit SPC2 [Halenospora varia]|nr:putative signal peptidase complex subunit SPC2 [Halenospora varia]